MIEVTCALIVKNRRILIAQNNQDSDHAFQWEFPGGKINPGENAQSSILREIREELDMLISIDLELTPVEYDYGIKRIRLIPFICSIEYGNPKLNEHLAIKWLNFEELVKADLAEADLQLILLPENQEKLKEYLGKKVNNA